MRLTPFWQTCSPIGNQNKSNEANSSINRYPPAYQASSAVCNLLDRASNRTMHFTSCTSHASKWARRHATYRLYSEKDMQAHRLPAHMRRTKWEVLGYHFFATRSTPVPMIYTWAGLVSNGRPTCILAVSYYRLRGGCLWQHLGAEGRRLSFFFLFASREAS